MATMLYNLEQLCGRGQQGEKLFVREFETPGPPDLELASVFALASLLWFIYGMLNRNPAIYVGNGIGLVMNLLMVNGILLKVGWTY